MDQSLLTLMRQSQNWIIEKVLSLMGQSQKKERKNAISTDSNGIRVLSGVYS
jgi:hypothetical protein